MPVITFQDKVAMFRGTKRLDTLNLTGERKKEKLALTETPKTVTPASSLKSAKKGVR